MDKIIAYKTPHLPSTEINSDMFKVFSFIDIGIAY